MRGRPCDFSPTPQLLVETMPAVYRGDPMTRVLCEVFDEQLAPAFATLDGLIADPDPGTTPEDMLDWLAAWIGLAFDGHVRLGAQTRTHRGRSSDAAVARNGEKYSRRS